MLLWTSQVYAVWRHMASRIQVTVSSGSILVPGGIKPLPEAMKTWIQMKFSQRKVSDTCRKYVLRKNVSSNTNVGQIQDNN